MQPFELLGALGMPTLVVLKDGSAFTGSLMVNDDGTYSVGNLYDRASARRFCTEEVEAVKPL